MKNKKNIIYTVVSHIIQKIYDIYYYKHIEIFLSELNKKNEINIVFDVGSHHGESIDLYLKNFDRIKKLYSFEPYSESYKILKQKFSHNPNIHLFNLAISNKKGSAILNIVEAEDGQSTLNEINQASLWYLVKKMLMASKNLYTKTELVKIDRLCNLYNGNIDFLKIDTEGNELEVLKSCENLLNKTKFIFIEIHNSKMFKDYNSDLIYNFLKSNSFIEIKRFKFPLMRWNDVIFVNKNMVKQQFTE